MNKTELFSKNNISNKKQIWFIIGVLLISVFSTAQEKEITLEQAVCYALENSHVLDQDRIKKLKAENDLLMAKNLQLPSGSISIGVKHLQVPSNEIMIGNHYLIMGKHGESYNGSFNISKDLYNSSSYYIRKSQELLVKFNDFDFNKDKDEIILGITEQYLELYKVDMQQKIVNQNIISIDKLINQTNQFYNYGTATKNDVLRFELQKSDILIKQNELQSLRKIINYNLLVFLGLKQNFVLIPIDVKFNDINNTQLLDQYLSTALNQRIEVHENHLNDSLNTISLKQVKANLLPKISAYISGAYYHVGSNLIPKTGNYITQFSLGLSLNWNIDGLWLNKPKINNIKIKQQESSVIKNQITDLIKTQVNQSFNSFQNCIKKVELLNVSIKQANENDRIMGSYYTHQLAIVVDRIDADTKLFQALSKMEIAKADLVISWYRLLKDTGMISEEFKQ